nr:MAG TPA: hypothetical protein [Crassvirales sp.]
MEVHCTLQKVEEYILTQRIEVSSMLLRREQERLQRN